MNAEWTTKYLIMLFRFIGYDYKVKEILGI